GHSLRQSFLDSLAGFCFSHDRRRNFVEQLRQTELAGCGAGNQEKRNQGRGPCGIHAPHHTRGSFFLQAFQWGFVVKSQFERSSNQVRCEVDCDWIQLELEAEDSSCSTLTKRHAFAMPCARMV